MKAYCLVSGNDIPMSFGVLLLECRSVNAADRNAYKYVGYRKLHKAFTSKLKVTLVRDVLLPQAVT